MVNWMNEDGEGVSIDGKTWKGAFGFSWSLGRTTWERKKRKEIDV